jgi:putative transcription factor
MQCEICGEGEAGYIVLIEGAKLNVCHACSGSGKLLRGPQAQARQDAGQFSRGRQELEPVEGYGKLMADARKRLGLPIEVLAERINEKLSFLERIEHEKVLPDEKVAHKLEKELGVKLLQAVGVENAAPSSASRGPITLGDIIEIERKEKKKKD